MTKLNKCKRCSKNVEAGQAYQLYCKKCIIELSKQKTITCYIMCETDDQDIDLSECVQIPSEIAIKGLGDNTIITDYLSDNYCWLVKNFAVIVTIKKPKRKEGLMSDEQIQDVPREFRDK